MVGNDIERLAPLFETTKQAQREAKLRIKSLGNDCSELAEKLKGCKKGNRCLSSICPKCTRRYRLKLISELLRVMRGRDLVLVTLIDEREAFTADELPSFNPVMARNKLRQQLRRAGLKTCIGGGLDGEFDSDRQVFQPHYHLICEKNQVGIIQKMAEVHYPGGGEVYRGCQVNEIKDNLAETIGYTIKSYWLEKSRYEGNRRRKGKRLSEQLHKEWLLWRSRYDLGACTVLYGLRRHGGGLAVIKKSEGKGKKGERKLRNQERKAISSKESE